jgi:hypothetical protein
MTYSIAAAEEGTDSRAADSIIQVHELGNLNIIEIVPVS